MAMPGIRESRNLSWWVEPGGTSTEEISERMIAELRLRDARAWWWSPGHPTAPSGETINLQLSHRTATGTRLERRERTLAVKKILAQKVGKNDGATEEEAVGEQPDSSGARGMRKSRFRCRLRPYPRCPSRYLSGTAVAEESKAGAPRSRMTEHNDTQYICRGCARPAFDQPRDQTANSASSPLAVARLWRSREPMRHDTTVIRCRHCRLIEAVPAVRHCVRVGLALRGQEWYRWRPAPT